MKRFDDETVNDVCWRIKNNAMVLIERASELSEAPSEHISAVISVAALVTAAVSIARIDNMSLPQFLECVGSMWADSNEAVAKAKARKGEPK